MNLSHAQKIERIVELKEHTKFKESEMSNDKLPEVQTRVEEFNGYPMLVITFGEYQGKPKEVQFGVAKARAIIAAIKAVYDFAGVPILNTNIPDEEVPF